MPKHIQNPRLDPANFYPQWLNVHIADNLTAVDVSYAFHCSIPAARGLLEKLVKQGKATKRRARSLTFMHRSRNFNTYTIVRPKE